MNHTATATRPSTRGRWTALNIVLMVLGFAVFWPLGLAMLAWIIWGEEIAAKAEDLRGHFRAFSDRAQGWQGADRFRSRTGNAAFDDYRAQELRRLEEERRKLEAMRAEFESFLAELRRVKDQEEFERFMREFRNRTEDGKPASA
jgi:Protein of unknown function (DUF2852)